MWREVEILFSSTCASAGFIEVSLVLLFFAWLFSERVVAVMELMSTKVMEQYEGRMPSSSLQHHLSQYQLRKREARLKNQSSLRENFDANLYSLKEAKVTHLIKPLERPVASLSCIKCCPQSRKTLPASQNLPIIDVLKLESYDKNCQKGLFSFFCVIKHCLTFKKYNYPIIYQSVLDEENLKEAVILSGQEEAKEHGITNEEGINFFIEQERKRAVLILNNMYSKISDTFVRFIAWMFYKALPWLFTSISIPKGQIDMLKKASASGIPLIFLPMHRSHLDYLLVTFILCNNGIRIPIVAAGENLNVLFFGNAFFRRLGAYFIKRRIDPVSGKKDKVYRAVLHNYMTHCLQAGHYFEFFIEGGRTRTGKPCMPKGGLMSVFVDAYLSGILDDALLVPVSINYEKLVEGSFISELTGDPKKPETFTSTLRGILKAFTSHYGLIRADFNQPFSLHELVRSFQMNVGHNVRSFHVAPSSASLYGTDVVNEEQRQLVDSITRHVLYDSSQSTAVMSTNALSFLLLYCFRSGTSLSQLTFALDHLREELAIAKKDTGFTGESKDIIEHAAQLLGPGVVQIEKNEDDTIYKPVLVLPNVLDLMYYSNTLITHFCIEGVLGRTLLCLTAEQENSKVTLDRIFNVSHSLCEILQYEFIFTKSCQELDEVLFSSLEKMTTNDLVSKQEVFRTREFSGTLELLNEDDDNYATSPLYQVNRANEKLELYGRMLEPLIDVYCLVTSYLPNIVGQILPERTLLKALLAVIKEHIISGTIKYEESLNVETVKNCIKLLEKWDVLDCHIEDGTKLYYLNSKYDSAEDLLPVINKVDQFRHTHPH